MPLSTNLNIIPFYDDYNPSSSYYKVLFQPGVSVQTRELNVLQDMLQNQIEQFGDFVLTSGTIVSGCNFNFGGVPYIKLKDLDVNGLPINPWQFVNYNLVNETTGMVALVVDYATGFETTPPNLKTLYLKYQNHGANGTTTSFNIGDTLKAYNPTTRPLENIVINNGGTGFSNGNLLIVVPQIVLNVTNGILTVGDYLNNGTANVQIVSIDSTTYANSGQYLVQVKPRPTDLANASANSSAWSFKMSDTITNTAATLSATVGAVIGYNYYGKIVTSSTGAVASIITQNKGVQYLYPPYVTVYSPNNISGYSSLSLTAQNYYDIITISSTSNSVGTGYRFAVTSGVIYQKGFFLEVVMQSIQVNKYSQFPDGVSVGFSTVETIVDSTIDPTLLDNVNNTQNAQAPGAMRLQMVPKLTLVSSNTVTSNSTFFPLCSWSAGRAYLQNQSAYLSNTGLGSELAKRTEDASGDFVIDPFLVTTQSIADTTAESTFYNVVIDPGAAYISGYPVKTQDNYTVSVKKVTSSSIMKSHNISMNYGNYFVINNVGGLFQFNTGDVVQLYDTAKTFIANTAATNIANTSPAGTLIGTANIRSLKYQGGTPGSYNATYLLYVFNIQMVAGSNINNIKSVYYNGTYKGIADIVLQYDPSTLATDALLQNPGNDYLTFPTGISTLKNANNVIYTYRTVNSSSFTFANTGILAWSISGGSETFPYTASSTLTNNQLLDLYVVPMTTSFISQANSAGTIAVVLGSPNITGTTTAFQTDYAAGDYVQLYSNGTTSQLAQINSITNSTFMVLTANATIASNAVSKVFRVFPQMVPIPLGTRSGLSANVNNTGQLLTINLGNTFSFSGNMPAAVAGNIQVAANTAPLTKTINRDRFVSFYTGNNAGGSAGPWCIGVPDVFRLKGVYIGNSSVTNTGTNYVSNFYIDHNQTSDFYNLSWLYLKTTSSLTINTTSYILLQFDYFSSTGAGFFNTVSYVGSNTANQQINDSRSLVDLTSNGAMNTLEIPEFFDFNGNEYDLLNQIDFRPLAANTTAPVTTYNTAVGSALNPSSTLTLSTTGEKKFPLPDSNFFCDIEFYNQRTDSIFVDSGSNFLVLNGIETANGQYLPSSQPDSTLKLTDLLIPPYPQLTRNENINISQILQTGVLNQKYLTTRINNHTIVAPSSNTILPYNQPQVYTMAEIGNLDRRLQQVEYYVTLNTLESNAANLNIPSSITPSLNRFKYGIFVDNFSNNQFSDVNDPQYNATQDTVTRDITPPRMTWDINLYGSGQVSYIDWPIISSGATIVPPIITPPPPPTCNSGYHWDAASNACIIDSHVPPTCSVGYILDTTTGTCIPIPPPPPPPPCAVGYHWDSTASGGAGACVIDTPPPPPPITDPKGATPECALALANTVAYTQIFRNNVDSGTSNVYSLAVTMASSATVYATVNYVQETLAQYLSNNPGLASIFNNVPVIAPQNVTSVTYANYAITPDSIFGGGFNSSGGSGPFMGPPTATNGGSYGSGNLIHQFDNGGIATNTPQTNLPAATLSQQSSSSGQIQTMLSLIQAPFISTYGQTAWNAFITQYAASGYYAFSTGYNYPGDPSPGLISQIDFTYYVGGAAFNPGGTPGSIAGSIQYTDNTQQHVYGIVYGQPLPGAPASNTFALGKFNPPVTLFFYNYDVGAKIEIFQGSTLVVDTSSAVALDSTDINMLTGQAQAGQQWFNDNTALYLKNPVITGSSATYAGKISFNYDPSKGNVFTVKTSAQATNSGHWKWLLVYPIDGQSAGCTPYTKVYANVEPNFAEVYDLQSTSIWCGNGVDLEFNAGVVYIGLTETWNPAQIPTMTTSSPTANNSSVGFAASAPQLF